MLPELHIVNCSRPDSPIRWHLELPDFYTTAQWSRLLHQEWNILSFMVWLHRENRREIQDKLGISRLGTSRLTNNATLSLWWDTLPPILSATCLSSCHWKLENKIFGYYTLQTIPLELHPSPPESHPRWSFDQREHWVLHTLLPLPPFSNQGLPPRASQGQPAEQLSHSSSSTQGGRAGLCMRQMVSALCNTLGQGRYFQKGFMVFFFLYFIFSISHFILLYRKKKSKCQTGHKEGHKSFLESSNEQMGKAKSHFTARTYWCPRMIVAMMHNSHLKV